MTIMITGARGTVGAALLRRLHARGHDVLAASRDPDTLNIPDELPCHRLDLADPAPFTQALTGVRQLFLYAEPAGIEPLLSAAQHAGVQHVVLLSSSAVTHPSAETDPLAAFHLAVERALAATSLTATVLRPGEFATNALSWGRAIRSGQPVAQAYPDAPMAPIHPEDIVDVAELALTSNDLAGQTITLGGPQSLSFREQLDIIAELLGHRIDIHELSREQAYQHMTQHMPEPIAQSLLNYWSAACHEAVLTNTITPITGGLPRTFRDWAIEHLDAFTPATPPATPAAGRQR